MNKKISHIFSSSHCPSEKDLLDYVKNRLDASKKHMVEVHLADCEMCSDYVEGLSLLPDADKIQQITIELNQKIDDATAKKPKARFFNMRNITAAAAVLTILVVVTFVLNNQFRKTEHTETAQSTAVYEEEIVEEVLERSEEYEEIDLIEPEGPKTTQAPEKPGAQAEKDDRKDKDIPSTTLKPVTTGETKLQDDEAEYYTSIRTAEIIVEVADESDFSLALVEESEAEVVSEEQRGEPQGASSKTERAKTDSRKAEAKESAPASTQTNQGIVLYEEKKHEASLKYFEDTLLKNPGDQTAQWYYALNLIALKRYDEAKVALNSIIQSGGKYKKEAEKELKKLK